MKNKKIYLIIFLFLMFVFYFRNNSKVNAVEENQFQIISGNFLTDPSQKNSMLARVAAIWIVKDNATNKKYLLASNLQGGLSLIKYE